MIYTLTGIIKRAKYIYYHVCCTFPDVRLKFLEMRRERTEKLKLYLICCCRPNCTAELSILIKDPIKTENNSSRHTFSPNVTEEMKISRSAIIKLRD